MQLHTRWLLIAVASGLAAAPAPADTAEYEIVFEGLWNASHATEPFPGSAHFTSLIGCSHTAGDPLWQAGELASPGIELVAELGSTSTLIDEIEDRIVAGTAGDGIQAAGIFSFPGEATSTFEIDSDHPEISLASMVAPSPDWFVGVSGLSLRDESGWIPSLTVDLHPYDAGTERGSEFRLDNASTSPPKAIKRRAAPFLDDVVLGRLRLTLLPEPGSTVSAITAFAGISGLARLRRRKRNHARR